MIFLHSGNIGDMLWSLPFVQHIGQPADYYIKPKIYELGDQYTAMEDLLKQQPFIKQVIPFTPEDNNWSDHYWPGLKPVIPDHEDGGTFYYNGIKAYDLDYARWQRNRKWVYHCKRYFDAFSEGYTAPQTPWINVEGNNIQSYKDYAIINYTGRWNASYHVDWKRVYHNIKAKHKNVYFIGFTSECNYFNQNFGEVEQIYTRNLLEVARVVRDAEAVYCNQSPILVLAQALGKEYYCAWNLDRTNCKQYTKNEHSL